MNNSDLRSRAETIIRLMDQADEIKTEINDRFEDAKNAGYTTAALRKAIKVYRMDADKRKKHESDQLDLETYLATLEGLNRTRLQEISDRGDKVVARFAAALERERAE